MRMRRPTPAEIPDAPGAYLFRDQHGQVLYVGKAKSLRKRVANYFGRDLQARTRAMVDAADSVVDLAERGFLSEERLAYLVATGVWSPIEAEYLLECPVKCHSCGKSQQKLEVVRMLRTKVNFTSSLPRRGFVVTCPKCQGVVSGYLGTI